jgi:hypothetical protein
VLLGFTLIPALLIAPPILLLRQYTLTAHSDLVDHGVVLGDESR